MGSTIYDVKVRYSADGLDQTGRGILTLGERAGRAEKSIISLKGVLGVLAGGLVFRTAEKYLIGANSEMEQLRIGMSSVVAMNLHRPFSEAQVAAKQLSDDFQSLAKNSPFTTEQFMHMGSGITGAIMNAGGSLKDVKKMTAGAMIASSAFGIGQEQASVEVQQLLMKGLEARNRFGMQLLTPIIDRKSYNKLDAAGKLATVEKALEQPALKDAGIAQRESFLGQTSTLKDNLQITLRDIGLPLMQDITAEVKKWNTWIEQNPQKIAAFAHEMSAGLVTGFHFIQAAGGFIVAHRKILLEVAAAFVIFRATGSVTGSIGSVAQKLGFFGKAVDTPTSKLASFQSQLGLLITATSLVILAVNKYGDALEGWAAQYIGQTASHALLGSADSWAMGYAAKVKAAAIKYIPEAAAAQRAEDEKHRREVIAGGRSKLEAQSAAAAAEATAAALMDQKGGGLAAPIRPEVNVHIHKLEVSAEDPGRVVYELEEVADKANRYAMGSRHALAGM